MHSNSERVRVGRVPDRTISITLGLLVTTLVAVAGVRAADHAEAPLSQADPAADIADVYAWHDSAEGTLTTVVTFDGR
jgi:hypothetical protein